MRATALRDALIAIVPTRLPAYLWGPPGIGKSSVVRQVAQALAVDLIDVRAVLLDPVDLRGLPHVNGDHRAHWALPDFLPRDGSGILFLDELAQAPPLVQSACLQLTLDRRIGEYQLPDGWTVIAASNRQEDRAGAHRLISPLLNRFLHLDLEISNDDWQQWAVMQGIAADLRAFLRFRPHLLFQFDPQQAPRSFPTPRSWEFVSRVLGAPDDLLYPLVSGCVGEGPAAEFIAFRRLFAQLPDVGATLANPTAGNVPTEPSVLYALAGAIAERCRKDTSAHNPAMIYAGRLPKEFGVLLVRDAVGANKAVLATPAGKQWIAANKDLLLS